MLDLVFLVLMVIVIVKAIKGDFNELLCNIALVVGVIASVLGMINAFFSRQGDPTTQGLANLLVFLIAFALKPVAKHFVKLYDNKIEEQRRIIEEETERIHANFNRPQLRDASYINADPASQADPIPQEKVGIAGDAARGAVAGSGSGFAGEAAQSAVSDASEAHGDSVLPKN